MLIICLYIVYVQILANSAKTSRLHFTLRFFSYSYRVHELFLLWFASKIGSGPRKFKYVEREQRNWVNKENWELWYRLGVTEVNTTVPCRTEGFKTPKLPVGPDCTASLI